MIKLISYIMLVIAISFVSINAFDPSQYEDIESEEELVNDDSSSSEDSFDPSQYEDIESEEELANDDSSSSEDSFDPSQYEDIESEEELTIEDSQETQDTNSQRVDVDGPTQNDSENNSENNSQVQQGFLFMAGYGIVIIVLALLLLLYSIHYFRKKRGVDDHLK